MPAAVNVRRDIMYKKLKAQFNLVSATLDPHLDLGTLAENGVDVAFVDLQRETQQGGPYFSPMSQERLESLDQRPRFDVSFWMEDEEWNYSDGHILSGALGDQMLLSVEGARYSAIEMTKWHLKMPVFSPA
jgi:hypothetical protein